MLKVSKTMISRIEWMDR